MFASQRFLLPLTRRLLLHGRGRPDGRDEKRAGACRSEAQPPSLASVCGGFVLPVGGTGGFSGVNTRVSITRANRSAPTSTPATRFLFFLA